jgi:hypothetical protein
MTNMLRLASQVKPGIGAAAAFTAAKKQFDGAVYPWLVNLEFKRMWL